MAILQFNRVSKAFNGDYILREVNFSVDIGEKIGLIGLNGCGKTTLFKIIIGDEEIEINESDKKKGEINRKKDLKIGYMSQNLEVDDKNTIFGEMLKIFDHLKEDHKKIEELNHKMALQKGAELEQSMKEHAELSSKYEHEGGYDVEYRIKQVLNGIGFTEKFYDHNIGELSGGQKNRLGMAKLLLGNYDILLLDEPTNHLDINSVEWLEGFLKSYKNAIIVISHDRYFLDNVVKRIYEIENKTLFEYKGNYTKFLIVKEMKLKGEIKAFEQQQEKIKETEEYIRKYRAGIKSRQAMGRQKILNRMERLDDPEIKNGKIKLGFEIRRVSGDLVLSAKNIMKKFGEKKLFENVSFNVYKGDRIGILGKNGTGKTTLLKIIKGEEVYNQGEIIFGKDVDLGSYDQQHENLNYANTIINEIRDRFPMFEEDARSIAGQFLFTGDDVFKDIGTLSGGEKARVSFIKLMLSKPNLLILDEPTNHLDIYSREVLEESFDDYEGTMIVVSHDRYFLEKTTDKIYELSENGIEVFDGDYEFYKSKKVEVKEEKKEKVNTYEQQKKIKSQINSMKKKYDAVEKKIEELEKERSGMTKEFEEASGANDYKKLIEMQKKMDDKDEEILIAMEEWENLGQELGKLELD